MDVAISWLYALLPIWMLYGAKIAWRLKLSVMVLLGLGALSSVAIIIRLRYVVEVVQISTSAGLASQEVIEKTLQGTIWYIGPYEGLRPCTAADVSGSSSIVEIGISIFATALTALRPLMAKLPCFRDISSGDHSVSICLQPTKAAKQDQDGRSRPLRFNGLNSPSLSPTSSRDNIITEGMMRVEKRTSIEIRYKDRGAMFQDLRQDWWC
ncbi:Uu.00g137080.m01.CDS01 [Anthostomella pinea]|uniref:Uu.00g137080.m01.CDS01 n=1 Tax=Anthostomella pinea TaxID=933095 RepID=A0AAI8VQD4_9PEZI|nr:Uu.00g137080.m01.CDS01 [Anthostomella pinea]